MRRFWSDRGGNIAVLFGLAIMPIIGSVGVALDYSLASAYRTDLQKSLDATALALTKIMPAEQAELDEKGAQYLAANLGPHKLTELDLDIDKSTQGILKVSVSAVYTPVLANLLGVTSFPVGASAEAKWSTGKVEVALVLDQSLSMQTPDPARIQALRAATVNLLNVLEAAARNEGDAKVGIVAFDGMINTGYTYATAPNWIRWDWWDGNAYDSIGNRCKINGQSQNFNVGNVPQGRWLKDHCENYVYQDGQSYCQGATGNNRNTCQQRGGKWVTPRTYGTWTSWNRSNWNGCVYDRLDGNDITDASPTNNATNFPAAKCYSTPPQAVTPLSFEWDSLRTKATNLTPTGYTNIAVGLAWGWHVLSKNLLFDEGVEYDTPNVTKYLILMTDGYNTKSINREPGNCNTNGPVCPVVDDRMELVCSAIKDEDIKIYTIRLIDGNEDLLEDCATDEDMYFDVQSAGELTAVFSAIGSEIANLHLSK